MLDLRRLIIGTLYTVYNEDDGMLETIPDCKAFVERNKHRFEGKFS